VKVLYIIIYKPFVPNLTNLKSSYYNHSSGVALVTLLQITKTDCSAQEPNILIVITYRKDGHVAGSETNLLMRCTYNKGLTSLEYKSTPQDLTDEKGGEDSRMQAQVIQDKALARIKVFCRKAHY
jgi:hypothetical protein